MFKESPDGIHLLMNHTLDEYGIWEAISAPLNALNDKVFHLGYIEGNLENVIEYCSKKLKLFHVYQNWGSIRKVNPIKV